MKRFKLPEINDQALEKLHQSSRNVYAHFKKENTFPDRSNDDILDSAVVLSIFGVFNPENLPMTEEQITEVFNAYKEWIAKRMFN